MCDPAVKFARKLNYYRPGSAWFELHDVLLSLKLASWLANLATAGNILYCISILMELHIILVKMTTEVSTVLQC